MRSNTVSILATGLAGGAACLAACLWPLAPGNASDHFEAPLVQADPAMDITDLYLFGGSAGKTVAVINYAGLNQSLTQPTQSGTYSDQALYTLHIDNTGDDVEDLQVHVRFGRDSGGNWGVQVTGLPGSDGPLSGPVEQVLTDGSGNMLFAGRRDDPFFFDAQGYLDTLSSGDLMIRNDRDFLAGMNCTSIVLEFDTAAALQGGSALGCWATSGRLK
ncbi:MAG: DUF4331 family protein [bacterium]